MTTSTRKYRPWGILLAFVVLTVFIIFCFSVYNWWMERRSHFVRFEAFGIDIPIRYKVHGIDVSKYQDVIDWQSVGLMNVDHVKIGFAFIKATEGLGNEDALFARNWRKAKEARIIRGAYHFFLATKSGKAQAENFINSVTLTSGDLPPVLDIEQAYGVPGELLRQRAREWLETVRAFYGVAPIVYTNVDFYNRYLKEDFDKYPLWVAHYLQPEQPRISRTWSFWQHSESGRVKGIVTRVDFNVFNGDSTDLNKLLLN